MAGDWCVLTLKEAGVTLIDCKHATPKPSTDGYPYIAIPQIKDGRLDLSDARLISEADYSVWTEKCKPIQHDVVVSRRCNPGETAVIPRGLECALGQNLVILRADGKLVIPEYLRWLAKSSAWWSQVQSFINVGAVFDSLTCAEIPMFKLPIPPIPTQRAIARILGTLDDKIELNRRMNHTLESIARTIFKSWFVDFNPVRAKMEGCQPSGMDAETASLFPDSFEDSDIGKVPSGWAVERFSEHFSVVKGLSYKGAFLEEDGVGMPMHNLDSVCEGGGYKHGGLKWYSGGYKDRHVVEPGDVVITNTEQGFEFLLIGYPAIIPYHYGQTGLFSHHLYLLKPKPDTAIKPIFMYFLLRTRRYHDLVAGFTNGTTVNMLPADGLEKPQFAVPPKALLDLFYSFVEPVQERTDTTFGENRVLASVRDTLLPKLISGEIRVKDADKFVEEHAC